MHTTYFAVPANTKVNVTILGYDGCTPLRNPFWGRVTGMTGGAENVATSRYLTARSRAGRPVSTLDSWAQLFGAAHVRDTRPRR